ncbi:hypothetical protein E4U55_004418 [Claviceps digitariae]|nr:hypothetical protein E4U55_004418 [Claviceps digitariae]
MTIAWVRPGIAASRHHNRGAYATDTAHPLPLPVTLTVESRNRDCHAGCTCGMRERGESGASMGADDAFVSASVVPCSMFPRIHVVLSRGPGLSTWFNMQDTSEGVKKGFGGKHNPSKPGKVNSFDLDLTNIWDPISSQTVQTVRTVAITATAFRILQLTLASASAAAAAVLVFFVFFAVSAVVVFLDFAIFTASCSCLSFAGAPPSYHLVL